jgi:IS5 family transposase
LIRESPSDSAYPGTALSQGQAATQLWRAADSTAAALWQAEFRHYRPLIERIVAQTERRVFQGETVAATEKIVGLFEPHADIIVKGGREVQYGHKLNMPPAEAA